MPTTRSSAQTKMQPDFFVSHSAARRRATVCVGRDPGHGGVRGAAAENRFSNFQIAGQVHEQPRDVICFAVSGLTTRSRRHRQCVHSRNADGLVDRVGPAAAGRRPRSALPPTRAHAVGNASDRALRRSRLSIIGQVEGWSACGSQGEAGVSSTRPLAFVHVLFVTGAPADALNACPPAFGPST